MTTGTSTGTGTRTGTGASRGTTLRGRLTALATGAVLVGTGLAFAPPASADRLDTLLTVGERLERGDSLATADGRIRLQLDHLGGLKLIDRGDRSGGYPGEVVLENWTGLQSTVAYLVLQADGNLVGYDSAGTATVDFRTQGSGAVAVRVQDDRNLVFTDAAGRPVASTDTNRDIDVQEGDFLLAGDSVLGERQASRLVMQGDGNLVLYRGATPLWSSRTQGNPGAYAVMQNDGNLVVYRAPSAGPARALFDTGTGYAAPGDQVELVVEDLEISVKMRFDTSGSYLPQWGSGWASDRLAAGDELEQGDRRTSPSGRWQLFASQVGLDLSDGAGGWTSYDPEPEYRAGLFGVTRMQADGNLVSYRFRDGFSEPFDVVFQSGTSVPGSSVVVQDDGNVVVVGPDGRPVWSRLTGPLR